MKETNGLFDASKNMRIRIVCIAAILIVLVVGIVLIVNVLSRRGPAVDTDQAKVGENAQMTLEEAQARALADAGIHASDVTFMDAHLEKEDGVYVYDMEFHAENMKYEYEIDAETGRIYSKGIETIMAQTSEADGNRNDPADSDNGPQDSAQTPPDGDSQSNSGGQNNSGQSSNSNQNNNSQNNSQGQNNSGQSSNNNQNSDSGRISLSAAKSAALSDAGLSASEVTYTKAELDYDDGVAVYEIEFYTSTREYEYEINAATGAVRSRDVEALETGAAGSGNDAGSESYIGTDRAKSAALDHAGYSASEVTFSKAELDYDDGRAEYEIEFYADGREYEYKIDAMSGRILEYDIDS